MDDDREVRLCLEALGMCEEEVDDCLEALGMCGEEVDDFLERADNDTCAYERMSRRIRIDKYTPSKQQSKVEEVDDDRELRLLQQLRKEAFENKRREEENFKEHQRKWLRNSGPRKMGSCL